MNIYPVFHCSLLENFRDSELPGRTQPAPLPVIIDDEQEWEVEEILDCRRHRKKLQYLIKWKGFDSTENTWEPVTNLRSPQLLQEFRQKYPFKVHAARSATLSGGILSHSPMSHDSSFETIREHSRKAPNRF